MLHVGLDIGSTTIKIIMMDGHTNIKYKKYERHLSNVKENIVRRQLNLLSRLINLPFSSTINL